MSQNHLTLYNTHDINNIKHNMDKINENIKKNTNQLFKPKFQDRLKIMNIILEYIKTNKRKIYGGYAINQLIKQNEV